MATQNLAALPSADFHNIKSINEALRDLENQTDSELPFLTDGFVDRCIAVTDNALLIRWIEMEEYRYGAL